MCIIFPFATFSRTIAIHFVLKRKYAALSCGVNAVHLFHQHNLVDTGGLEPSTFGTTIRRSNQLSYIHRVTFCGLSECKCNTLFRYVQKFRAKNRGEIAVDDKMSDCPARLSCKICQKGVGTSLVEVKGAKAKQNITINLKNAEL